MPKKSVKPLNLDKRVTVYYGYGLFLLIIISLLVSYIPWGRSMASFMDPLNLAMLYVTFVFTALAPGLIGYLAGDGATRSRSKLLHHYNGVLFGVLGVWIWIMATPIIVFAQYWFPFNTMLEQLLYNLLPAIIAALVTIGVAVYYARQTKHQRALIDYTPYRVTLIGSVAVAALTAGITSVTAGAYGSDIGMNLLINVALPLAFILFVVLIGYVVLGKRSGTTIERLEKSLLAAGFGAVAIVGAAQITAPFIFGELQWLSALFIFIVWLSYLILIRQATRR